MVDREIWKLWYIWVSKKCDVFDILFHNYNIVRYRVIMSFVLLVLHSQGMGVKFYRMGIIICVVFSWRISSMMGDFCDTYRYIRIWYTCIADFFYQNANPPLGLQDWIWCDGAYIRHPNSIYRTSRCIYWLLVTTVRCDMLKKNPGHGLLNPYL